MTERKRLPNRRQCNRYEFVHGGFRYFGVIGFRPGTKEPTELFLQAGKAGTAIEAIARDAAILASLALQHGAGVDDLRHALTRLDNNSPAGPVAALLDHFAKNRDTL